MIETIARRSETMALGPAQIFIAPWGRAMGRVGDEDSPLTGRDAFVVHPLLLWEDAADDERMIAFGRSYREDLRPYATGNSYLNFIGDEGEARKRAAFGVRNHARLAAVKADWDPDNVFASNANVAPRRRAEAA